MVGAIRRLGLVLQMRAGLCLCFLPGQLSVLSAVFAAASLPVVSVFYVLFCAKIIDFPKYNKQILLFYRFCVIIFAVKYRITKST